MNALVICLFIVGIMFVGWFLIMFAIFFVEAIQKLMPKYQREQNTLTPTESLWLAICSPLHELDVDSLADRKDWNFGQSMLTAIIYVPLMMAMLVPSAAIAALVAMFYGIAQNIIAAFETTLSTCQKLFQR